MRRDPRVHLWDVREASDAIASFIADVDLATYSANSMIHSAVERKFEIIGEALNLLAKADPALATRIPDLAEIIAFRNLLIHGYAVVQHARVWRIAKDNLPGLRAVAAGLLDELDPL